MLLQSMTENSNCLVLVPDLFICEQHQTLIMGKTSNPHRGNQLLIEFVPLKDRL